MSERNIIGPYPAFSLLLRIAAILLLLLAIFGVGAGYALPLWAAVCYVASTFL